MATRSFIAKLGSDGKVRGNYCHWDGDMRGVGKTLGEHYTRDGLVDALLSLGALSSLGTNLTETVAYHRDRKEPLEPLAEYSSVNEMLNDVGERFAAEWAYVYDGGTWRNFPV